VSAEPTQYEGEQDAEEIIRRHPIEIPKYRLDRVHVATLNVDYAPPHGAGYARPLSQGRLARLRRDWDPMACGPLVISRRTDSTLWVIDGNHRRVVAFEYGMTTLPAQIFSGIDRFKEADLYTKLGTVLGQTPMTRFRAKMVAGDFAANEIHRIVEDCGFELDLIGGSKRPGTIQAVARIEWIFARGSEAGLRWVLRLLDDCYDGARDSVVETMLEGTFGFWLRYAEKVDREILVDRLHGAGLQALDDRSAAIYKRYQTTSGNSFGRAMADMYNQIPGIRRLPDWQEQVVGPNFIRWGQARFTVNRTNHYNRPAANAAPQQLGVA